MPRKILINDQVSHVAGGEESMRHMTEDNLKVLQGKLCHPLF